jgi:large subunit ribosomal protein L33
LKSLILICNNYCKIVSDLTLQKMAKNKGSRVLITLECLDCRQNTDKRSPGISRYTSEKNRRNTPERLELKKFCRHCNRPTIHKEIK